MDTELQTTRISYYESIIIITRLTIHQQVFEEGLGFGLFGIPYLQLQRTKKEHEQRRRGQALVVVFFARTPFACAEAANKKFLLVSNKYCTA